MTAVRTYFLLLAILFVAFGAACGRKSAQSEPGKTPAQAKGTLPPADRPARAIKNFLANPTDHQGQRIIVRGDNAVPLSKDVLSITNLFIQTERNGSPDMIITAARCLYNTTDNTFSSDGELSLRTADKRLSLQGRGFLFLQREARLIVSNDVTTAVRWRSLSGRAGLSEPIEPATASGVSDAHAAEPDSETVEIRSRRLDYRPELALFDGNVLATETHGLLRSDRLTAHFVSNRVERVEVDQNVVVEQGPARATGDRGAFTAVQNKGIARLMGHATWQDQQHSISADTLVLDRVRNTVRGEGNARLKAPRQTLSQSGEWFTLSGAPPNKTVNVSEVIELSADWLTLQLPPTNGPVRRIEAERNVVIASSADNSRATAGMAVYDEGIGTFELTADPILAGRDYLVRGARLVLNRTNRVFSARRNAYVRIPVAALSKTSLLPRDPVLQQSAGTATNHFIETYSDDFDYGTNQMNFLGNVRAHLVAGDLKQGDLQCADLQITFGDRLEKLCARGGVRVRQFPAILSNGNLVSKELVCETLTVTMDAEGRLADILAEQEVVAQQLTTRTNSPNPSLTKVSMDWLKAKFFPQTNQVESIIAERNVRIEQEGRTAQGHHAVFDGASRVLELTGQPTAMSPEGRITQAEVLVWDAPKQLLRVRGPFKSEWQRLRPNGTNDSSRSLKLP